MKILKSQLKQIIKEEYEKLTSEGRYRDQPMAFDPRGEYTGDPLYAARSQAEPQATYKRYTDEQFKRLSDIRKKLVDAGLLDQVKDNWQGALGWLMRYLEEAGPDNKGRFRTVIDINELMPYGVEEADKLLSGA